MNTRKHFRNLLVLVALGSLLYMALKEVADQQRGAASGLVDVSSTTRDGALPKLIVYYFSEGKQCTTCENIELYTREALETYFAGELASGTIVWRPIDVDQPRNEHYISEYDIYTKSVVLVRTKNGKPLRWKNLDAIWDLIYDKAAFVKYIRAQTGEYLDAAS